MRKIVVQPEGNEGEKQIGKKEEKENQFRKKEGQVRVLTLPRHAISHQKKVRWRRETGTADRRKDRSGL